MHCNLFGFLPELPQNLPFPGSSCLLEYPTFTFASPHLSQNLQIDFRAYAVKTAYVIDISSFGHKPAEFFKCHQYQFTEK